MERKVNRSCLQGVWNVLRFNWHFYLLSGLVLITTLVLGFMTGGIFSLVYYACAYVYDLSGLYELSWIKESTPPKALLNLSAGFDETTPLLQERFPQSQATTLDFYEALGEKEISIQRARQAYPLSADTQEVGIDHLPLADGSINLAFSIFVTHEIRDQNERIQFFKELYRVTHDDASLYVVEHLRDIANFAAYTIGFLHFLAHDDWLETFKKSGWTIDQEKKHTPFISIFTLKKNHGISS